MVHDDDIDSDDAAKKEREVRLEDVERRLKDHPGYREYVACEELARTVNSILVRNLDEIMETLVRPTRDEALAVELFQNMHRPDVREAYEAEVTQRLHNYVAGAATLVDHARRLMRGRTGTIADEFERRKLETIANPEVPFIKDLRNLVLHRTHPFLAHTVKISDTDGTAAGEIELSRTDLLAWDRWSSPARAFIKARPESFVLRHIVLQHGRLMVRLHNWLHNELAAANAAALDEANHLQVERNAILGGFDFESAKRMTEAITKLRESPEPIKTKNLPNLLRGES